MDNGLRRVYLPRLPHEFYRADAVVHWTLSIENRATGWLTPAFHSVFRELMLHAAVREGLMCPVYCLMPDHIHLVWMGTNLESDQKNGMAFLRRYLEKQVTGGGFQNQAHDHVLGDKERKRQAFAKVCQYILLNPFKAGLLQEGESWAFCGCIVPGYPTFHPMTEDFWPKFWKIYFGRRDPKCSERVLPPRRPTTTSIKV